MPRTRSKAAAKSSEDASTKTTSNIKSLPPNDTNPPKLFILPKNTTRDARILSLPDPASKSSNRYLFCPEYGLYEFTRIAAPKSTPRSLLFTSQRPDESTSQEIGESKDAHNKTNDDQVSAEGSTMAFSKGYLTRSADLFVTTPVDLVFFLLPILAPASPKNQKRMFLTFDDHIDSTSGTLKQLLQQNAARKLFENRLPTVCDMVEAGDESMYRLSIDKLAALLLERAKNMAKNGLPASMEEKYIRQALQAPILSIKRDNPTVAEPISQDVPMQETEGTDGTSEAATPSESLKETQSSIFSEISATTSMTSISASEELIRDVPKPENTASEEIKHLLRLRTALSFLQTSYISLHLRSELRPLFADTKVINFCPLDKHMEHLNSLREEALALRALSDNITRKRGLEDDEAAEARAEKKRKKEEEEKKKKMESRAAKELKKVDTSGMKKLSSFFTKVPKK